MRTRPADLDDRQLIGAVERGWGHRLEAVEWVGVGGGSHHWRAADMRIWLTLDDLDDKPFLGSTRGEVFDALRCALEVASSLEENGLDFVVAPVRARNGAILEQVNQRYALAVYPLLEGTTFPFGRPLPPAEHKRVLELLVRLHQATPSVAASVRMAAPELAARQSLEAAVCSLDEPWPGGPFSEPARVLLARRSEDVSNLLRTFDDLLAEVRRPALPPVITHGEPHPANLMLQGGSLRLLDWDTVGLAPPERDLWWLADAGLDLYTQAMGSCVDRDALRLYRLRWLLDDLIYAVRRLRAPHWRTIDTQRTWDFFSKTMEDDPWMY
jgi:spectinomycin phosphotransferase